MTKQFVPLAALLSWLGFILSLSAQDTAMTYQGRLNAGGVPANGFFDLTFTLYDSSNVPGRVIAGPLTNAATVVSRGVFTVTLNFGAAPFDGGALWLEIGARTNGSGAFTTLAPRQPITWTPYAVQALNAVSTSNYTGQVADAQLSRNIALLNGSNVFTGAVTLAGNLGVAGLMTGNGAGLINLKAANLTGQIPAGNLSGYGPLAGTNVWSGMNSFKPGPIFIGTNASFSDVFDIASGVGLVNIVNPGFQTGFYNDLTVLDDYRNGVNGSRYRVSIGDNGGIALNGYLDIDADPSLLDLGLSAVLSIGQDTTYGVIQSHYWPYDPAYSVFAFPVGASGLANAAYPDGEKVYELLNNGDITLWRRPGAELGVQLQLIENDSVYTNAFGLDAISNALHIGPVIGSGLDATVLPALIVNPSGSIAGNGSGLTNLNAAALTGLIPRAQYGASTDFTSAIGDGTNFFPNIISHAHYTAVGGLVFVEIALNWSGGHNGAHESSPVVINLPLAVAATYRATFTLGWVSGITFARQLTAGASVQSAAVRIFDLNPGGAPNTLSVSNCAASGEIQLSGVYREY